MPTMECRLAKVEEKLEMQGEMFQDAIQERRRQADRTYEMLEDIHAKVNRMQGFSAGVAMVFGMIGAAASFLWDRLSGH